MLRILRYSSHSLVNFVEGVVVSFLELAYRTVIGVHWNLFLVVDLEQGRMLLHNLDIMNVDTECRSEMIPTRVDKPFIGRCS
jgi:hypothetical protein